MKQILLPLLAVAALASCAKVEEQVPQSKDGEIHITAGVDGIKTRAIMDPSTDMTGATFVIKEGTSMPSTNFSGGTAYTGNVAAGDGKVTFTGSNTPHYNVYDKNAYMVAYFPGGALTNNAVEWTIDGKTDIMLTNNIWDAGKYSAPIETGLNFNHQLTRIEVAVMADEEEGFVSADVVRASWGQVTKIELLNAPTKMKYDLTGKPTVSTSTPTSLTLLKDYNGTAFTATDIADWELDIPANAVAMVAPMAPTSTESFKLRVTTLGAQDSPTTPIVVEVPVSLNFNNEPMQAGFTYKIYLEFKAYDKKIEVTTSTIEAWAPGYEGGSAMNTPTVIEYGVSPYQIISGVTSGGIPYTIKEGEWKSCNSYTNITTDGADNGVTEMNLNETLKKEAPYRKFEIAKTDESEVAKITWQDAWAACKAKYPAGEWRLPRISELALISLNLKAINNINGFVDFKDGYYWSGTGSGTSSWVSNVHLTPIVWLDRTAPASPVSVRCIREIPTAPVILDFKSSTISGTAGGGSVAVTLASTTSSFNNYTNDATDASNNGGYYTNNPQNEKVYAKLEIAKESEYGDAPQKSWQAAWDACKARAPKGEWRLPRTSELVLFYFNWNKIKQSQGFTDFTDAYYWAGTEQSSTSSWLLRFLVAAGGTWGHDLKEATNNTRRVRCVREIPLSPTILERGKSPNSIVSGTFDGETKTVGNATSKSYNDYANTTADATLNGGYKTSIDAAIAEAPYQRLEIAKENEQNILLTWADAWRACKKKLPAGTWRVPRISELMLIFLNKTTLAANSEYFKTLEGVYFWSGTENASSKVWVLNAWAVKIEPITVAGNQFNVRCVRER